MGSNLSDEALKAKLTEAMEQVKKGDLDNAIGTLKAILSHQPQHEISLGMLASIYLQIGMHEQAIAHYETLLKINPENPLARFQLGMAKLTLGQPETALEAWEPMLTLENEFMANFHGALALIQLRRNQEALERLTYAARHMPCQY